ncbi:MAG: hypothetical protein Q4B89_07865 [Lachnospiraceae bacterium]|nr:hypothetical protein [Lachnospiraceae bacterium]
MRTSILKNMKLNDGQVFKNIFDATKCLVKDKHVQAGIFSIPIIGWTISEYKRHKDKATIRLYQEALRKHQAIIDALENDKERESYKQQLWEKISSMEVEV